MANNAVVSLYGKVYGNLRRSERGPVNFTVMVNTTMKNDKDQFVSNFYNVAAWGNLGENLIEKTHLKEGMYVWVVGELQLRKYEDKNGNPRESLDVNASKVIRTYEYQERRQERKSESEDDDNLPL